MSQLWRAVVHPYCLHARVGRPSRNEHERSACPFYPDCPISFPAQRADYCLCPVVGVINLIFLARRFGKPTAKVPSATSPAVANAARRVGLAQHYQNVPPREDPASASWLLLPAIHYEHRTSLSMYMGHRKAPAVIGQGPLLWWVRRDQLTSRPQSHLRPPPRAHGPARTALSMSCTWPSCSRTRPVELRWRQAATRSRHKHGGLPGRRPACQ